MPSGVWADAVSRRALLVLAPLLSGTGFALWVVVPSTPAFAAGFVLWGASGGLRSGAFEALAYEELDRLGAADAYARVNGRVVACETVAATVAIGLAAPAFALGGYALVGAASVAACLGCALVALTLPEHRAAAAPAAPAAPNAATAPTPSARAILAAARAELRASPALRRAALLVPLVTAVWGALDEYLPLLAVELGAAEAEVPLLFLAVYLGLTAGGLLGGRVERWPDRAHAALLAVGALALAAGAASGTVAGVAGLALAFLAFQAVTVVVEARLQHAIDGTARSTVTSLAGVATELLTVAVFAGYAAGSTVASHATLFVAFAAAYLAIAPLLARGRGERGAG